MRLRPHLRPRTTCAAALFALACAAQPVGAAAQTPQGEAVQPATHPYAAHVAEAAQRFGIPETWIWAVMRAESNGAPNAVSHAGAMGLMQIMPRTWAELRVRYALGRDPHEPRDNIMAGAAYLREMYDAYGSPGFLAAYNAGPDRYEQYRRRGRPLPSETRNYVAQIAPQIGSAGLAGTAPRPRGARDWTRATLFVERASNVRDAHPERAINASGEQGASAPSELFVRHATPPR